MGVAWVYWRIYSLRVEQYIQRREAPLDILHNPSGVYYPIYPCHAHYIITIFLTKFGFCYSFFSKLWDQNVSKELKSPDRLNLIWFEHFFVKKTASWRSKWYQWIFCMQTVYICKKHRILQKGWAYGYEINVALRLFPGNNEAHNVFTSFPPNF